MPILNKIKQLIPRGIFHVLQPAYHFSLSWLAAIIHGNPSRKLIVVGVTGTTGKTTSVYLIAKILEGAGYKTGFTSTALFNDGEREWLNDKKMTMVGRFFTQKMLKRMVRNGCCCAIIETTSEGVRQFRHRFINYDILVITGLYPEHIESHGSFENYKRAKGELFKHLKRCSTKYVDDACRVAGIATEIKKLELKRIKKTIIANGNDPFAGYFLAFWAEEKFAYLNKSSAKEIGPDPEAIKTVEFDRVMSDSKGTVFYCQDKEIRLRMLGEFNAENAMAAITVGTALSVPFDSMKSGLENIGGVPGRLEKIDAGQNFTVIIDYAFEPNALLKLYDTLEKIPHNSIIHVLGSTGGGRDVARRPVMGRIAGQKANFVIITNEDPYDDDPQLIIDQVAVGAEKSGKNAGTNLLKILERREAIKKAFELAENGDIVIITGKGCEQGICGPGGRIDPWDDRVVARELLEKAVSASK